MNRFFLRAAILGLLLAPPPISAQEATSVADRIIREGTEHSQVMEHLDHLVNKIGPRLTGSTRLTQACEWTRDAFKGFGIDNARLEEWGTFPVGFDRGPWSGEMVAPEKKQLVCATMAWTAGTDGPVEGPAVLAPENDVQALDMKAKLKGAWVVVSGRGPAKYQTLYDEARIAGLVRTQGKNEIMTSGNHGLKWENRPKRVAVYLTGDGHKEIVDLLKGGREVRLKFDIRNEFKQGPIALYNVLADIVGSEKPDEYVIVGGHIDSWDGATGTTDNGTGVATTLEAARLLMKAGAKPKRTIRFMLWGGEEQGLLGSRAYVRAHPEECARISAVLNHDGGTNYVSSITASRAAAPFLKTAFAPVLGWNDGGMRFEVREASVPRLPAASDHLSFLQKGVPAYYWDQEKLGEKGADYSRQHHTQYDTFDVAIPEFQRHSAVVIAVGALGIADLPDLLPRPAAVKEGAARRTLGINVEETTILSVIEGTPAEKAGLLEGDEILKIGDRNIATRAELVAAIQAAAKETTISITRDGKAMTLSVTFEK